MNEFFYEPDVKILMLKGEKGDKGEKGNTIVGIEKTSTSGLVDTYTIRFNDGTASTFNVTNGEKGDKGEKGDTGAQGIQGEKGDKGDTGAGTPTGGKAGQYLKKKTDTDYDFEWSDIENATWDNVSGKPSTFPPTPSVTKNFTLSSSSWSNGSYTIRDSLITATSNQEIIPAPSISADQYKAFVKASIVATGQTAGAITIKAFGTTPTINIPVTVIFRGTI